MRLGDGEAGRWCGWETVMLGDCEVEVRMQG